jgi:tetratricopeptide (TPR) repeat protein
VHDAGPPPGRSQGGRDPSGGSERSERGGNGFAHDLVAAAVRRSIPDAIARVLHARLGRALLAHGHPPGPVAAHLRAARAWAEAAPQTLRAAEAAALQGRHDEATELLEHAARAFEVCGDHEAAFDARVRRADSMIVTGSLAEARAELAQLGKRVGHDAQRLRLGIAATRAAIEAADGAAAVAAGQAAQGLAQRRGDDAAAFEVGHLLGSALSLSGQGQAALAQLEPMLAAAAARPARERCAFHGSLGYALGTMGRLRDAVEHLRVAAQLADELGDNAEAMTLWSNLSGVLNQLGRTAEAAEVARRARERTLHAGKKQGIAVGSNETMLGLALGALGHFDEAEQVMAAALERFTRAGAAIWAFATEGMLANLYVHLGQLARAKRLLANTSAELPAARRARRLVVQARLERAAGRSGLEALRAAQALLDGSPQRSMDRLGCLSSLSQVVPPDEALSLLREVRATCEAQGMDAFGLTALVREADAWRRAGDVRAAVACARAARAAMRDCQPHDLYLAEGWWLLHGVFAAAGDEVGADEALREGAAWLQVVLPHVPPPYRDAFVHRQRINRLVLAAAARRRLAPAAPITSR